MQCHQQHNIEVMFTNLVIQTFNFELLYNACFCSNGKRVSYTYKCHGIMTPKFRGNYNGSVVYWMVLRCNGMQCNSLSSSREVPVRILLKQKKSPDSTYNGDKNHGFRISAPRDGNRTTLQRSQAVPPHIEGRLGINGQQGSSPLQLVFERRCFQPMLNDSIVLLGTLHSQQINETVIRLYNKLRIR